MSLICETIVSEDELSQSRHTNEEEELDFEEEEIHNEDKDEGLFFSLFSSSHCFFRRTR